MADVITRFQRPQKKLLAQFKDFGAATVYEAAGRIGSVDPVIKPLIQHMRLLGPALTVRCHPRDNLMLHKALQIGQPGDIIVADTDGYPNAGYFGDLMATSAMARQIGGLAIDGCVRDSAEIIEMGFPIFCRGTCMRGTVKQTLGSVNHPVLFGDVVVNPGDLVIGISGSGNSENVLRAVTYANEHNAVTLGICGYDGGKLKRIARHHVWANINDMQISEDVHFVFGHIVMQALCENEG